MMCMCVCMQVCKCVHAVCLLRECDRYTPPHLPDSREDFQRGVRLRRHGLRVSRPRWVGGEAAVGGEGVCGVRGVVGTEGACEGEGRGAPGRAP